MKPSSLPLYAALGLAAAVSAHGVVQHLARATETSQAVAPAVQAAPGELRYAAGSPQLAYLSVQAVSAAVPPLMEPLPARLVADEDHTVRLFSPVAGRVTDIPVQLGQTVKAGQVLAWLQAPDYDTAVADLRKAQADQEVKTAAWHRSQRLLDAGVVATRELEAAQADARAAQAEVARAAAHMRALGAGGGSVDGRFALRAPIDGVVSERHINPGQEWRADASDPAFVITDPARLDVLADVPEAQARQLHVGQAVRIGSDDEALPAMEGRIRSVGVVMDPHSHRVPVRARLASAPAQARAEMFVRLSPLPDGGVAAVLVPNSALVTTGLQSFVFVERSPGVLQKTAVTLALRGRDSSYIAQGVAAGQHVVTKGALLLDAELATGR
ncbi:MAG: efflux RND transporter periplasmic adaptor subunit [Proteobacteria bacterium]|uniref:efflux RND transporter periplasmic adaptor subunit n=1 Tax=Aquabacterium sp. TaxID=1872578 RepID=UPI0035C6A613|nr:efflux RND transporter periplasmic adaptor subunit [Pseudomonadota bacterium]